MTEGKCSCPNLLEKFHGFSISRCQSPIQVQNWRTATAQVHSLLTARKPCTLSERLPQTYLWRGTITCLALQRPTPVAASCPPGQCSGNRKKGNQKRRLSSLKVPDTFSLIPFSLWDLTRKYRHCFGPFQSHNVSVLLKLPHLGAPLYPCHYSKKICEDTGMRVGKILIKHSHTHTKITPYLSIWKTSLSTYFISILFHYGLSQDTEYSSLCSTGGPCCLSILYIIVWTIGRVLPMEMVISIQLWHIFCR